MISVRFGHRWPHYFLLARASSSTIAFFFFKHAQNGRVCQVRGLVCDRVVEVNPDGAIAKVLHVLGERLLDVLLGVEPDGRVELLVHYLRAGGHLSVVRSALVRRSDSCERRRCLSLTESAVGARPLPAHESGKWTPSPVIHNYKSLNLNFTVNCQKV